LWMSYRECSAVSKIIFGDENEQMAKDFMLLLHPHLVGQRTENADSRRIDITQFLHLAVVGYHQSHPGSGGDPTGASTDEPNSVFQMGGDAAAADGAAAGDDAAVEHFTNIQQDREREFLDFICGSFDDMLNRGEIVQENAEQVLNKLYYQLRVKINASIGSIEAFNGDVDAFDEALVNILRKDSLREEMETMRDELIVVSQQ
jgi:hypothetical protein